MIVVDTNIIFHLFNVTPLTSLAQKVYDQDPIWIIPSLWKEEFGNVLSKVARKEKRALDEVLSLYESTLKTMQKCEKPVDPLLAFQFSLDYKISVYDAHFLVLAYEYETKFISEDIEIIKKCPQKTLNMQSFVK